MATENNPFVDAWRSMLQQWEAEANKSLTEAIGREDSAKMLNGALRGALQMQSAFTEAMEKSLAALNLPTRSDVLRLSEQIGALERKIDALTEGSARDTPEAQSITPLRSRPARTRQTSAD